MYRIRRATPDELDSIHCMDAQAFGKVALTRAQVDATTWWVAACETGDIVAYAGARVCRSDETLVYLSRCAVKVAARGAGLQRRLIRARLRWAKAQGAAQAITYTMPYNAHSSNNLIRCGFLTYDGKWVSGDVIYWFRRLL